MKRKIPTSNTEESSHEYILVPALQKLHDERSSGLPKVTQLVCNGARPSGHLRRLVLWDGICYFLHPSAGRLEVSPVCS